MFEGKSARELNKSSSELSEFILSSSYPSILLDEETLKMSSKT